jgi:hypothetical protein
VTDRGNDSAPAPAALDYAGRPAPGVRTSRLAAASLVVAVLCAPCLLAPLLHWLTWEAPQPVKEIFWRWPLATLFMRGSMILATALPVAAIVRIKRSKGARGGMSLAVAGLLVSILWWGLLLLALLFIDSPR